MKIFISQPMNNRSTEDILFERNSAYTDVKKILGDTDVQFIDSFLHYPSESVPPLWMLGYSIQLMSEADAVYFVKGWQEGRGCIIEHECAEKYGIQILKD